MIENRVITKLLNHQITKLGIMMMLLTGSTVGEEYEAHDNKVWPGTVTILVTRGGSSGLGSGFFLNRTTVVTALHVIAGAERAEIRLSASGAPGAESPANGRTDHNQTYPVTGVLMENREADMIVLSVDVPPSANITPLVLATVAPQKGERVFVFGHSPRPTPTVLTGIVACVEPNAIYLIAPAVPGDSGGAVVNGKGEVIGIMRRSSLCDYCSEVSPVARLTALSDSVTPWEEWKGRGTGASSAEVAGATAAGAWTSTADGRYARGQALMQKNRLPQAIKLFETIVAQDPGHEGAWSELGGCRLKMGRFQEGLEAFQKVLALQPKAARSFHGVGDAYRMLQEYEKALEAYREARRLEPDYPFFTAFAFVLVKCDRAEEAPAAVAPATLAEEAVEECQKAFRLNPQDFGAYAVLSQAYHRLGKPQEAQAAEQEFLKLRSK